MTANFLVKKLNEKKGLRLALALLLPFAVCWLQWQFWSSIKPFVWFLFFPTVFFSSRIGGKAAGLVSTVICATLVVYCFMSPQFSFLDKNPNNIASVVVFIVMGALFSFTHDRLERANRQLVEAKESVRLAHERLQEAIIGSLQAAQLQTADELAKSEKRFRQLFKKAPVALCFVSREGVLTDFNEVFVRMFGYHHEDVPTVAQWSRLAYPDPAYRAWASEAWDAAVSCAAASGNDMPPIEYKVVCKDGSLRKVLISGVKIGEDFLSTFYDVTESRLAEDARRESEERQRLFILHAPAALAMFDKEMRYLHVSRRWLRDYGLGERDLTGLCHYRVFANIPERWRQFHRRGLAGEVLRCDADSFEAADGSLLWVRWEIRPWRDAEGAIGGIVIFTEDITDLKRIEEALREQESMLKEAKHLAKLGNWSWDTVTGVHHWSEEIYQLYGRNPALPPAAYPEVASYFTPESWARLSAAVELGLSQGVAYQCDAQLARAGGVPCWVVARGNAQHDERGQVVRLYGTVQDITERKLAEEEIRKFNTGLELRVAERTAELLAANLELDAFAYAVSHDLRAPLRAMNGFSQALVEDYGKELKGEALEYLGEITLASRHMGELIDGLLTLSRSTRGELDPEWLDLTLLAERVRAELCKAEPERQVAWQIEPGMTLRGNPRMIEVVMRNLLGNAWKYTAGAASPLIRVYSQHRPGASCFCIADNGAGFDMKHAARLFKPFQRLHRQDEFPGIGIGLATVLRILHHHGGEISAQAEPGRGASFFFSLPVQTAADNGSNQGAGHGG